MLRELLCLFLGHSIRKEDVRALATGEKIGTCFRCHRTIRVKK